ncbi:MULTISPECIES: hypothetical protein [unclassified Rathayibacter]|uniref:hypothetical protein n=1 Tax=unclassified Rathayibacter TaxID=2609250 RepID=UPI0014055DC6|nr:MULTISPECIES: hypothetical protein [unclassified Rathayibacter]
MIVAATSAPAAVASTTTAALGFDFASFTNGTTVGYGGTFTPLLARSAPGQLVTDITAFVTLIPAENTTYSAFSVQLSPGWTLVQALGDGAPGTIIFTWHGEPGLSSGESAGRVSFEFAIISGPPTDTFTVTVTSPTADSATVIADAGSL